MSRLFSVRALRAVFLRLSRGQAARALCVGLLLSCAFAAVEAEARVGGGSSYSRSSSRSSSSSSRSSYSSSSSSRSSYSSPSYSYSGGGGSYSGSGGDAFALLSVFALLVVIVFVLYIASNAKKGGQVAYGGGGGPSRFANPLPESWGERARHLDPGFVEVLFLERAVMLITRLLEAAPRKVDLEALAPYVAEPVTRLLLQRAAGTRDVRGVTIGSIQIQSISTHREGQGEAPRVVARVHAHLNRHVVLATGAETSYYSHEEWIFHRAIGAPPTTEDKIARFGCPGCGSPVERDAMGRCAHCQTSLAPGAVDWMVRSIRVLTEENKGPLLGQNVEEVGTYEPTSKDPTVLQDAERILGGAERVRLLARAKDVFVNLQAQWTAGKLEGIRPFETDALFQSHRFWLEEYQRQGLRNVIDDLHVARTELCRVEQDGDYVTAMLRIHARCLDYTVQASTGRVVSGSKTEPRAFTEYWTLVKHKSARPAATAETAAAAASTSMKNCPSCGAPLSITAAGTCEYCQTKVTLGRFDWVLSRIDQDEDISGDGYVYEDERPRAVRPEDVATQLAGAALGLAVGALFDAATRRS